MVFLIHTEIVIFENMPFRKYRVTVNALRKVLPHVPCCPPLEFSLLACILAPHNRHQRDIFPHKELYTVRTLQFDSSSTRKMAKDIYIYIAQTKKKFRKPFGNESRESSIIECNNNNKEMFCNIPETLCCALAFYSSKHATLAL